MKAPTNKDVAVKHDKEKLRYDLIPAEALKKVVEVYTIGAKKYGDYNWLKGMEWKRLYAAMQRHANKWWMGATTDGEDGQHHLASVVFCALTLMTYEAEELGKDDRPPELKPLRDCDVKRC